MSKKKTKKNMNPRLWKKKAEGAKVQNFTLISKTRTLVKMQIIITSHPKYSDRNYVRLGAYVYKCFFIVGNLIIFKEKLLGSYSLSEIYLSSLE